MLVDDHLEVGDTRSEQPALRYDVLQQRLREEVAARLREAQALREHLQREEIARQQERQREVVAREAAEREVQRLRAELDRLHREHGRAEQG